MLYENYPTPVTVPEDPDDEAALVVHRDVRGQHTDTRTCWCCPHVFTFEEVQRLTTQQLNERIAAGVH